MRFKKVAAMLMAACLVFSAVEPAAVVHASDSIVEETMEQEETIPVEEVTEADSTVEEIVESAPVQEVVEEGVVTETAPQVVPDETVVMPEEAEQKAAVLQNGTVAFKGTEDAETVKVKLASALLSGYEEGMDLSGVEFEYYCEGKSSLGLKNTAWGSVNGFESQTGSIIKTTYKHPALKGNADGNYQVRLAGTTGEVTVIKTQPYADIVINENASVPLVFNDDASVNYDETRQAILNTVIAASTPELTLENTTIEYYATVKTGAIGNLGTAWMPLEGGKKDLLEYPAIKEGTQKIRITFHGDETYVETLKEVTVAVTERQEADFTLNEGQNVQLVYNDDATVNYAAVYENVFNNVVTLGEKELTLNDVTVEYYATAKTGAIGNLGTAWMPLEGGTKDLLEYPAIKEGTQKIRISYAGDKLTAPTTKEVEVTVLGRPELEVTLNEAPYEVGLVFNEEQGYNYDETANAIVKTVIASTVPEIPAESFTVKYNAGLTSIAKDWKPLNNTDITNLKKFGAGNWEIRISWTGTKDYKDGNVVVDVTTTDSRTESVVIAKEGTSFTYNKDANVMKQDIFNNVIDWENSTLPARETLDADDFELKYNASPSIDGDLSIDIPVNELKRFVKIEGESLDLPLVGKVGYPQMGAGQQQISLVYKGNAEYRPSAGTETTVTVNKAKVKVNVKWTNIFAGKPMPEDFVTVDQADDFDVYTIYTGITSNVSLGIYVDFPETFKDSTIMKIIDPVVKGVFGKTLTQMLNEGMTVGEFRQMFATDEILDVLDKVGVDTNTFREIIKILDATSGIVDGVRISFGTPNRAGLYSAIAVTDNKNYETGVGFGTILVRLNSSGVKLNWNQAINGTLTAEQAKTFDFGVTLSQDGDVTIDQSNVSYLYSGLTSKWKLYSSTTTPPTEPGNYIVTVVTLGGNYLAAPITRTFKIK